MADITITGVHRTSTENWRDKLRQGSFRGAGFFWQKSDGEGGRKTARHDYPLRDEAYVEDLGKAPREFTLDVLVIGGGYMVDRDRLIAALEEPGPGTLIHPTFGAMRVSQNGKYRWSESTAEGGMARFTLCFVQEAYNKQPSAAIDSAGVVVTRYKIALNGVSNDFGKTFDTSRKPAFIIAAAKALVNSALDKVNRVRRLVAPPLIPAAVTDIVSTLDQIRTGIAALVYKPIDLAHELQGLFTKVSLLTANPFAAISAYGELFKFGDDQQNVPRTTGSRITQANNQKAVIDLVKRSAAIEAARSSSSAGFSSYREAQQLRQSLVEQLDELMYSAPDEVYTALAALRLAVIIDITSRGADLARIVPYTPKRTLPALVIAYQVYGDASQASTLVERNRIRHPGFVPGGMPLEVLTNV